MDNRCQAVFDQFIPTHICAHCSSDCLVNMADELAEEKGYDIYVCYQEVHAC